MFALPTASAIITNLIVLVFAFTLHELAHAVTADRFGDPTPRREGRITLNPLAHLDILGTLLFLLRGFGWARPVNVDPYYLRRASPSAMMWVSVAGPLSNLGLALLAAIPFRLGLVSALRGLQPLFTHLTTGVVRLRAVELAPAAVQLDPDCPFGWREDC
jgi:Zn-dependent protease